MLSVYTTFKKRITDGRGDRLKSDLESLAGGRVYSGVDALKVGLIDEIGGLNEAIEHAAKLSKLDTYQVHLTPEPKSGLEGMFTSPDKKESDDEFIRSSSKRIDFATLIKKELKLHPTLGILPAHQQKQLENLAKRIESYRKSRILLIGPDILVPSL